MAASRSLIMLMAEGFGLGRMRHAPGTWGSLWGLPLGWVLGAAQTEWPIRLLIGGVCFVIGVPICTIASRQLGRKDPPSVVWDEIAAFPLVYAFVPISLRTLLLGFVLFRVFDISKLWPARQFERLPEGWGIMADDQIAGLWACLSLWLAESILFSAG